MSKATDQHYLKRAQYQDASNLNARIAPHQRFGTGEITYVLSGADRTTLTGETMEGLQATVEQEIEEKGAFRMDKMTGLSVAQQG